MHVGVLSTNSNSPGRILRPNRLRCVNCLALPIIIISMETINDLYALRRPRLSPTAPSPGANPVYGTSFETTRARRMLRRFSAAVATSREGRRSPRSFRAVQHRRWGRGPGWRAFKSATTPLVTPFWSHSALRTAAREEGVYQRYLAFASLQLVTSLAVGRTIANVDPPAAVPQITGADT